MKIYILLLSLLFSLSLNAQIKEDIHLDFRIGPSFGEKRFTYDSENVQLADNQLLQRGKVIPDFQLELGLNRKISPVFGFNLQSSRVVEQVQFNKGIIWKSVSYDQNQLQFSFYLGGKYSYFLKDRIKISAFSAISLGKARNPYSTSRSFKVMVAGGEITRTNSYHGLDIRDIKNRIGCRLGLSLSYQFKNRLQLTYNYQYYNHLAPYLGIHNVQFEHPDTGTENYTWYSTLDRSYHLLGFSFPLFKQP